MIIGAHSIVYSKDSDADRAFLRDVLAEVARSLHRDAEQVAADTTTTARAFFGL